MKRMHVHVGVDDLAASVRFYSTLFGVAPSVERGDYAKWMLDDPKVNFAISAGHATRGIEHLGIQVEDAGELAEVRARLRAAERPVLEEGAATCCYAKSEKSWIADPQGVVWEAFLTVGDSTDYGHGPSMAAVAKGGSAAGPACCAPAMGGAA
jgi:catechol 2,3-dioxygenase-like lactoylglutathione lyase family enzyme